MTDDTYYTISDAGEGQYREKMSRFLAFAIPVSSATEAKDIIKEYQNRYHDARHVCWAYRLGPAGEEWQLNDNGEPSGTAGKPILGQLKSKDITDALVIVVRYFGGIKLGTSGLITAYKEAARMALESAAVKECHESVELSIGFPYETTDKVLRLLRREGVEITNRQFDTQCSLSVKIWKGLSEELIERLKKTENVTVE
ncbi:MAG: YigZ family protein [Muribaculum sp.]|nr:YigZ family protein [Muribaculum sp.]